MYLHFIWSPISRWCRLYFSYIPKFMVIIRKWNDDGYGNWLSRKAVYKCLKTSWLYIMKLYISSRWNIYQWCIYALISSHNCLLFLWSQGMTLINSQSPSINNLLRNQKFSLKKMLWSYHGKYRIHFDFRANELINFDLPNYGQSSNQGCPGQGKVREIPVFLRVREKSGNFVASQEIL